MDIARILWLSAGFLFYFHSLSAQQKPSPDFLNASAPIYQPLQVKLGFNLGWTFPYSGGAEFSLLFKELIDVNAGVGIGMSGLKYGAGTRIYPFRSSKISPMVGVYVYRATGTKSVNISVNMNQAEYRITPDTAILFNGGMRMRFGRGHYLTAAAGYVFPFHGDQAVYKSGSRDPSLQSFANTVATSGLSINFGILLKLSSGNYKM